MSSFHLTQITLQNNNIYKMIFWEGIMRSYSQKGFYAALCKVTAFQEETS